MSRTNSTIWATICRNRDAVIEVIERSSNHKAEINFKPLQPGDVKETYADISASQRDFGFTPKTSIDEGIPDFVDWYREYHDA